VEVEERRRYTEQAVVVGRSSRSSSVEDKEGDGGGGRGGKAVGVERSRLFAGGVYDEVGSRWDNWR
jgi:hypothetical protein